MSESTSRINRRRLVKAAALTAVTGAGAEAQAQEQPEGVTAQDMAAASKLSGRSFTASEREQMARRAAGVRTNLQAIRKAPVTETTEPAALFSARLPSTPVPAGKSSVRVSAGPLPAYSGGVERLAFSTAAELSRLLRARKVTSVQLTRMYLERLKQHGPRLNCLVTLTEELALRQAERADRELAAGKVRGPLHGIPWGAKDILATRGIRTTWGAYPYAEQIFDYDATVVERLEAAGAVLVGKLSTGELALGDLWFGGRTLNPWNTERGSSGSSAGPGSAVAAGLVGFAIGSETLGSIVSPSVENGVTGLRPTFGRVSRFGAMTLAWSMDKLGPMCRGVEDCALVLAAIQGPDGRDGTVEDLPFRWDPTLPLKKIRVGYDRAAFEARRDAERQKLYAEVLAALRRLGIEPAPVTLPAQRPEYGPLAGITIDVESAASFAKLAESGRLNQLARQGDGAWPNTFRVGSTIPAVDYLQALRVRRLLQREMEQALKDVDVYVTVPFAGPNLVYTNLTGHPTLITRCGFANGLPVSVEFVGNLFREAELLRVAFAYEQATEWHRRHPDV
jgi:Asp-tRNA(Asn)/Glu-tRNA(Gln) amidotransferase A subunit family amidase